MQYIIKKNINLFGELNVIKFGYDVKINNSKNGFENFDIDNESINLDNLLKKLNEQTISELNKLNPIYISLSDYFFKNLSKLSFIEYETIETISRIERKDLI